MMRLLLDTHVLLWSAGNRDRLPTDILDLVEDPEVEALFSTASILEIAIKHSLGREDFRVEPGKLRRRLIEEGYVELPVLGDHAVAVATVAEHSQRPLRSCPCCTSHR